MEMPDHQPHELTEHLPTTGLDPEPEAPSILEDDDLAVVPPTLSKRGTGGQLGGRFLGLIATLAGLIGCLLSLAVVVVLLRFGLAAGDSTDRLIEPIASSVSQLETRVDQADELVGRSGVPQTDIDLLSARADSLADLADGAQRSLSAIADHPVYRWLPLELEPLEGVLGGIERSSTSIAETAASGADSGRIPTADAAQVSEELNQLQAGFGEVRDAVETARDSISRWMRLAALAGVGVALWSLWAQSWLLRRGWRGVLGHAP